MNEFDLYSRILSEKLVSEHQDYLVEKKAPKHHQATIYDDKVNGYLIFRYDMDEKQELFLPFFNHSRHRPDGLLEFCDYIIIANRNERLFVILVEMKSGTHAGASKQLEASKVFMDYVKATALRICAQNGYDSFSEDNIILRKVILKPAPKAKPQTNIVKKSDTSINWDDEIVKLHQDYLPLFRLCRIR